MNKNRIKWKSIKNFAHDPTGIFFKKCLLLKKDAKLVLNGKTRTSLTFMKPSREDFITGVSHRMIWTVLKTDSGHVALLTENFFPTSNPERLFSSLKKTIFLYLVKKFETFMMIFTSGRRRLFFKKNSGRFVYKIFYTFSFYPVFIHGELQMFFNSWCCILDYFILNCKLWHKFSISMIIIIFLNYLLYSDPLLKFWMNLWIYGTEECPHMWPKRLPFFLFFFAHF